MKIAEYDSTTGKLSYQLKDRWKEGVGYSGHGVGCNNPGKEMVAGVGPIPRGMYAIGPWEDSPKLGPCVAQLVPLDRSQVYDRSGFYMHGDNREGNRTGSDGCIVQSRMVREDLKTEGYERILVK